MRILFLIGSLDGGGAERQLSYLAEALAAGGDHISIALLSRAAATSDLTGVSVVALRAGAQGWFAALRRFRQLAREHDIVYSFMDLANVFAAVAVLGLPINRVWGLRSSGFATGFKNRIAARLGVPLSAGAQVAICNAQAAQQFYQSLGYRPKRWAVVPNAVDTEVFHPAAGSESADRPSTVAMIARADPIKRHDLYFQLARQLQPEFPETQWLVAGAGTDEPGGLVPKALQRFAPTAKVQLCGPVSDVAAFLRRCDLLVSCSDYEGSSNVLFEALASEVPVVSFAAGDAAQLLEGCGTIVEPASLEALAAAVAELLRDAETRKLRGAAGRRKMLARYSIPTMARASRQLLLEALERSGGATS